METGNKKKSVMLLAGLLLIGLFIFNNTTVLAQEERESGKVCLNPGKSAVMNFLYGLNSDNDGLRKSCIYFAGKYKISEVSSNLLDQLKKEQNQETKLLISLALNEIGVINIPSTIDEEIKVKEKFAAIFE